MANNTLQVDKETCIEGVVDNLILTRKYDTFANVKIFLFWENNLFGGSFIFVEIHIFIGNI